MNENKLLLRAPEVAEMTGLSKQGIYQLAAEGRIPCVRIGRSVRFPAAALPEWVKDLAARASEDSE